MRDPLGCSNGTDARTDERPPVKPLRILRSPSPHFTPEQAANWYVLDEQLASVKDQFWKLETDGDRRRVIALLYETAAALRAQAMAELRIEQPEHTP